ncbi:MAG: hypothetical protein ABIR18_13970 [Chitinophagaceae bacterium]
MKFAFTIKNQFTTTLSTLEGAKALRKEFLEWQREFYKGAVTEAAADPVKGYVFGKANDTHTVQEFITMLHRHEIDVYSVNNSVKIANNSYDPSDSYVVPKNQAQSRLIKAIFSKTFEFKDSLFYDITSWTMPLAFGLRYDELNAAQLSQAGIKNKFLVEVRASTVNGKAGYAYLLEWSELTAPAALYELLDNGILSKVATNSFELAVEGRTKSFRSGTIVIPAQRQTVSSEKLVSLLQNISGKYGIGIDVAQSGNVLSGNDLGSARFVTVTKPSIAMITGTGVNATDAGEVWHLLDQRMNIPATHLEPTIFNRADLNRYNTLIMVGGTYPDLNKNKLRSWVEAGGVLILTEEAVTWAAQNGISNVSFKKLKGPVDSTQRLPYATREQIDGAQQVDGAIFGADVDLTHPLAYGYNQPLVSLFKANKVFMEKNKNPYSSPFYYGGKPLQSGWVSQENAEAIKNSSAVLVNTVGSGRVINIGDNPNFRAFWLGGTKLFMNAIFFGRIIDAASGRAEE